MMQHQYDTLPGKPISLWLDTTPQTNFPSLGDNLYVDVAIVGGGIVGLTAATLLKEQGKTVAVLEAKRIVAGVSGNTTAKVTSLHTLIYAYLIQHFGKEKAQIYATANETAIQQIADFVQDKQINCEFSRTAAYTYAESDKEVGKIYDEVEAALKLGLPASFTEQTPLPFPVKAAVRFDNQAQFHPRQYLLALARDIPGGGSHIFENTQVLDVSEDDPCVITTNQGTINAAAVIVASHFPFNDKVLYATRLKPHRSYVLAARLAEPVPQGMFITTDSSHTMRHHSGVDGEFLLVGGEGHIPGQDSDTIERYQRVEQWARDHFNVKSIVYRWSTQDNQTLDRLPYVGRYSPTSHHVYVAAGFGGWGMTNSMVAGMILRDLILERENPWADLYDPNRINLKSLPQFAKQSAQVAKHFVGDRLTVADTVEPGEGKIVNTEDGVVAVHMAEDGSLSALSPACTHMGCFVQWNSAEKSWDCPCHGSRFARDGTVIHGPALKKLEKVNVRAKEPI